MMNVGGVDVDDQLGLEFRHGNIGRVLEHAISDVPSLRFLRGIAFLALGRISEGMKELEQCDSMFPIQVLVQRRLSLTQRNEQLEETLSILKGVEAEVTESNLLGTIRHVRGITEGKLRRNSEAVHSLMESIRHFCEADNRWMIAQARDTLGTVEAARGRLVEAVQCYAMALVDKSLLQDRLGTALTLGNLGRVHMRAGRFHDAEECFQRDLELSLELGDPRGIAKMYHDLGRAKIALGDWCAGEENLQLAMEKAHELHLAHIEFDSRIELASLRIEQRDFASSRREIELARKFVSESSIPYFQWMINSIDGQLLVLQKDASGLVLLESAVQAFRDAGLPDLEIATRLSLAKSYLDHRKSYAAEKCLLAAQRIAIDSGFQRYMRMLNETLLELDVTLDAELETGRGVHDPIEFKDASLTSTLIAEASNRNRLNESDPSGNYLLREELGSGTFGKVYRAYDSMRGIEVALKKVRTGNEYDPLLRTSLLESIKTELQAASRIRHPGIVRVYAIGSDQVGDIYICQELIAGESLRAVFDRFPQPAAGRALPIWIQILFALAATHDAKVFHRDLKPANILLRESDRPVLIDFGMAQLKKAGWFESADVVGTVEYMAPEQAQGKAVDAKADLYSVGVMMYEWFAGVRPIRIPPEMYSTCASQEGNWTSVASAIHTQAVKPITIYRPDLSQMLAKLIHQLLEKKPRKRPTNALVVAEVLRGLVDFN